MTQSSIVEEIIHRDEGDGGDFFEIWKDTEDTEGTEKLQSAGTLQHKESIPTLERGNERNTIF